MKSKYRATFAWLVGPLALTVANKKYVKCLIFLIKRDFAINGALSNSLKIEHLHILLNQRGLRKPPNNLALDSRLPAS